jgi:TolA-binding protein
MVVALALSLLVGVLSAGEDKVVKYKNKEVVSGSVKSAELTGVEIEIKDARTGAAAKMTLPASDIAEIEWDIADQEWRSGISAFNSGGYVVASRSFLSIINEKEDFDKIPNVAKPALIYYAAESLYRAGKPADAVPVFERLINENKTSYYAPRAVGSLVDAAIQTKTLDKVPPLLGLLRSQGGEQKALADYYEGQMLFSKGQSREAEAKFASAAMASSVPATKGMALMGQAQCAIGNGDLAKGRQLAQQSLAAEPPASVAGAAHLIIGDAIVAEVDKAGANVPNLQEKLMDALLEYVRVFEQYKGDPRTEPEAMLKAGLCLQRLSKLPNRGGDKHRAQYLFNKLNSEPRFRATRFAQQAQEALRKM